MKQGSKVLCINDKDLSFNPSSFDKLLMEGSVYCVREMIPGYDFKGQPDGVMLEEIIGKIVQLACYDGITRTIETHFKQNRFRVIEEIDIQAFEEVRKELITNKNIEICKEIEN